MVPGLLGPFSEPLPAYIQQQLKQPEFKLINKLFSRASVSEISADSYFETLAHIIYPQCQLSLTQLTAEADGIDISQGFYYRADPVHFKAESDHAILIGTDLLLPTREEAEQLVDAFNQHFLEDDLSLHFSNESRWYLKTKRRLDLSFSALDYALGRDIKHFMPQDMHAGDDALWWRKILNEAQMLFFQHAVNQHREDKGALAINGLWLWDQPLSVACTESSIIDTLFSDDVVANALADKQGVSVLPVKAIDEIDSSAALVVDKIYESVCYGDVEAWLDKLSEFCASELQSVFNLLSAKKIDEIVLYPCNGQVFKFNRSDGLKFWKKKLSVAVFVG